MIIMEWLNKVLDNNETIYVAVAAAGGNQIHTFTSSGTWTMIAAGGANTTNFFALL